MSASGDALEESFRVSVERSARRIAHVARLALSASRGPEPETAADYLLDVREELRAVRRARAAFRP